MSTFSRPFVFSALFTVLLFLTSQGAHAATYTVTNTTDSGAGSLRQAIITANSTADNDTIDFALSDCPCTIVLTSGELAITSNLTINGPGAELLSVSGNNTSRVLFISGGDVSIKAITVTGGNGVGTIFGVAGGVLNLGTLTLADAVVRNNSSSLAGRGGGIYNGGSMIVTGSTLNNNFAGSGGGIYNGGQSSLTMTNSKVGNNSGSSGGGIVNSGTATLNNSIVNGNHTTNRGGGIVNVGTGLMTLNNSIVSGNSADSGGGGGIVNTTDSTMTMTNSTVSDNSGTAGRGGGIANVRSALTIINSTVSGNSADSGGGIANFSRGTIAITSSTVSGNTATGHGGGIEVNFGTTTVTNSTISGNAAHEGGGIYTFFDDTFTLVNSIVANSTGGDCILGGGGGVIDATSSLFEDGMGCVNGTNVSNRTGDPKLGTLQFNGGPTKTHALLPGSQAINTGGPTDLTTDQRGTGFDRVVGGAADIGAFEVQPACSGFTFGAATSFAVGDTPLSVAVGDFNGDGRPDLATANLRSYNVSVLLGNGAGGFAPAAIFAVGGGPAAVAVGDFNGDGRPDLATANQNPYNVSVLLGDGAGGFAPAANFAVGGYQAAVATGDFNGDGKLDLTTANGNNVSVLLGDGAGGFAPAAIFAVGGGPAAVAVGDFNGDGRPDLATANQNPYNVSVLLGDGAGGFAPAANFAVGGFPGAVAIGDFNGDGRPDLATANLFSGSVSVLLGDGAGGFAPAANFAVGGYQAAVATGDFNGDGKLDLTTANGNNVSVLPGDGAGGFAPAAIFPAGNGSVLVTAADFNADGKLDLATANSNSDNVSVLLNSCGANTAPVANNDAYSTDEDTVLNVSAPGVLANDTDGDGDSLTAAVVTGPSNGTLNLSPNGSFTYTPNANFNGPDSFTYKANDSSLYSNVATVTITVNAVNDAPVVSANPPSQPVQYSDSISSVAITATDIDSASLGISTQFKVGAGAFGPGLPEEISIDPSSCTPEGSGVRCTTSLTGEAKVAAGVYTIRFTATDGAFSVGWADHILTVNKEHTATEFTGDVYALTAGPTVTTANVRLAAQLAQDADGYPGDITEAKVSFLLFKAGNLGSTPDTIVTGVAVDASGAALTFANLAVDTWTVKVKIDAGNGYWKASPVGMSTITIEQPTTELRTSGGGWVADGESVNGKGNFGFNVANQKKGVRGSSIYLFRGLDGFNYIVKSTTWNGGGIGFRTEGSLISLASFSGKCVVQKIDPATGEVVESFGNYSFTVDGRDGDLFNPRQPDKYAITILNSGGLVWRQIGTRASPLDIGGGNVTVKGR